MIMSAKDAEDRHSEIQREIEKPQTKRTVKSKETRKQSVFAGRIIEVREKKGLLQAAIPTVPVWFAWICLFVNVLLPGIGTFIISFAALSGAKTCSKKPSRCVDFLLNILSALIQLVTAVIIIGWIFSIAWGMNFVNQATDARNKKKAQRESKQTAM